MRQPMASPVRMAGSWGHLGTIQSDTLDSENPFLHKAAPQAEILQ